MTQTPPPNPPRSPATAQAEKPKALPKRFYKTVSVERIAGGYVVTLDGRSIKTPARANLRLPTTRLAKLVAQEWADQGEFIDPASMVITGFCNAAIDRVTDNRAMLEGEVSGFADTDTLSYREEPGSELAQLQDTLWEPVLQRLEQEHGAKWLRTTGIMPGQQDEAVMALAAEFVAGLDKFALTAFSQMAALAGSFALILALTKGDIDADGCWTAAFVENDWQARQWGEDAEAQKMMADRRKRFDAAWSMWQALA